VSWLSRHSRGDQLSALHRAWTPCAGPASDDVINPASQL
jgi:hypothetical protein